MRLLKAHQFLFLTVIVDITAIVTVIVTADMIAIVTVIVVVTVGMIVTAIATVTVAATTAVVVVVTIFALNQEAVAMILVMLAAILDHHVKTLQLGVDVTNHSLRFKKVSLAHLFYIV